MQCAHRNWHHGAVSGVHITVLVGLVAGCSFPGAGATSDAPPGDDAVDGPGAPGDDGAACGAIEIASYASHNCVRRADGEVRCWGYNEFGNTGVDSTQMCGGSKCVPVPAPVAGLPAADLLGLGDGHSCARAGAAVYCWGRNDRGQFGTGQTGNSVEPVLVPERAGATVLTGGDVHACSLAAGAIKCAGRNQHGELGDNSFTQREAPITVGLSGATALTGGFHHTCAIAGGLVWCWGENDNGQVAPNAPGGDLPGPTGVVNLSGPTQLAAGENHSCALTTGGLSCWGGNANGQLGDGTTEARTAPVSVMITGTIAQVVAGANQTCARDEGGAVSCWGEGYGATPQAVGLGRPARQIASGAFHACARLDDDSVWCWGRNYYGQLGDGSVGNEFSAPVLVSLCAGS